MVEGQSAAAAVENALRALKALKVHEDNLTAEPQERIDELRALCGDVQKFLAPKIEPVSPVNQLPLATKGAAKVIPGVKGDSDADMNVLIVDDDQATAMMISHMLKKLNIRNSFVLSGQEALDILCDNPEEFHIVLCDVNMPGLDGGEVLQRILASPQLRYIPIVMVSSSSDVNKAKELVQAGAKDYIVKPIQSAVLVSLSGKVRAWRQSQSIRHLSSLYELSSALLLHIKIELGGSGQYLLGQGNGQSIAPQNSSPTPIRALIQSASLPIREMLGLSREDVASGRIDALRYVIAEDRQVVADKLESCVADLEETAKGQKLVWRWVDINRNNVPVVGHWSRFGEPGDSELVLESTSLLPSLMLKREKERRQMAELKAEEAHRQSTKLREEMLETKKDLRTTKKTGQNMRSELTSMICEISEFSKMVTENPHVLTWRFHVATGNIDFVSQKSCKAVLGYDAEELVGKSNENTLHPDDLEMAQQELQSIGGSVRIRRKHKSGSTVWLESCAYAWWDEKKSIVVVTEYDITPLISPQ